VFYRTLSFDGGIDGARRDALDAAVLREGGAVTWHASRPGERSYALLALPDEPDPNAVAGALPEASSYDGAIIALAVFPAVLEALPHLHEALGGPGRPAGVLACLPCPGGAIVEWDPLRVAVRVVLGLVDLELRRFNSGRTAEVLSPLPPELVAAIAAQGLDAPQIEPARILELRIDRA
jgi:hypothetical protein